MQSTTLISGLIIAAGTVLFLLIGILLMERRWKRLFDEIKTDSSSQPMWLLMQQQMEQLRGHMSDGLNKNISLLTEQFRAINEQVSHQLQLVNQQLQNSSGQIGQRLDTARQVIVLGLKGLQIEKEAQKIQALLSGLKKDFGGFQEDFQLVGRHISNAMNKFEEARRRLDKFTFRLEQIESQPALPFKEKRGEEIP